MLFRNLENKGNPWGQNARNRLDWAKDLRLRRAGRRRRARRRRREYLFWVGCAGAFDDRAQKTARAVAELMHLAGVGFVVLGPGETCTGDPARRAGNEFLFQMLAAQNVEMLNDAFEGRDRHAQDRRDLPALLQHPGPTSTRSWTGTTRSCTTPSC